MNRGLRDGSSGYDSSDNETSQQYKQNRKYRSDPDFRMQNVHPSYQQPGVRHLKILLISPLMLITMILLYQTEIN